MASKDEVLEKIHQSGVIGIFRVDRPDGCIPAMEALVRGGLRTFEVTMTTPGALAVVSEARRRFGESALVGAGTVLDREGATAAVAAGAQFVVSPSLDRGVIEVCAQTGVVSCPGTFTPTEMVEAWKWGADLVKVFPISPVGPEYIRAVRAPLPHVRLVPTGGIDASNLGAYLAAGAFAVGIGGSLLPPDAVRDGRYELIAERAAKVVEAVKRAMRG